MEEVGLGVRLREGESHRDAAIRIGGKHGLEYEVVGLFDRFVEEGQEEGDALLSACMEWDVAEMVVDGKFQGEKDE